MADATELARLMEPIARRFLGTPRATYNHGTEWRYGNNEGFKVDISDGTWYDHTEKDGGGLLKFIKIKMALEDEASAAKWLEDEGYLQKPRGNSGSEPSQIYPYFDQNGILAFQVLRYAKADGKKTFRQRAPDPNNPGNWKRNEKGSWTVEGVTRVLYRLPEVLQAIADGKTIFIVEGEKDADRLWSLGLAATCNPGGAGKWSADYSTYLRGAHVVVIPDNDTTGRDHAEAILWSLNGIAASSKRFDTAPPEIQDKTDISDWLNKGGTAEELRVIVDQLPPWKPSTVTPLPQRKSKQGESLTEQGVMRTFVEKYESKLRYNHTSKTWFIWRDHRWRSDEKQRVLNMAFRFCRDHLPKSKDNQKIRLAKSIEEAARAQEELATMHRQWDASAWLLGTPGGIVDLETGEIREGKPEDMISKKTICAPATTSMNCPRWLEFVDYALNGNEENIAFLKRSLGYGLTGSVREEKLLYCVGRFGTGKGTLMKTYENILADYAASVPIDMFTNPGYHAEYYRATLAGYRVVIAAEPEKGSAWSEGFVNELTGGDKLSGRHPMGRPFDFTPVHKLMIHGNAIPELKNVASGLRRRLLILTLDRAPLIPDTKLKDALKPEYPAILRWLIDGCLEWQERGLDPPESVREAVEEYFEHQDVFSRWITERCNLLPTARDRPTTLRKNYNGWADANGERRMNSNQFHDAIKNCRFANVYEVKINGYPTVKGLVLKTEDQLHEPELDISQGDDK